MAIKTKGLTRFERRELRLAIREDTLISGNDNYPVVPSRLAPPLDGSAVQWWHDLSQYGASFGSEGDVIEYRSGDDGVEFVEADTDRMVLMPNISSVNLGYFNRFLTGSFTAAVRFRFDYSSINEFKPIFTTGGDASNNGDIGFTMAMNVDGNGDAIFQACLADGSGSGSSSFGNLWDTRDSPDPSIQPFSGINSAWVHQDASGSTNQVEVYFNGSRVYGKSGFSLLSGDLDSGNRGIIGDDGSGNYINMTLQGLLVDTIPGRGERASEWIQGNDYNANVNETIGNI